MTRWRILAAVALIAAVVTLSPRANAATTVDVAIVGTSSPFYGKGSCATSGSNNVTVNVGDTVRWSNCDAQDHTVSADDGSFTSGHIPTAVTFTRTFNLATPNIPYHCDIHPSMHGVIHVVSTPPTVPPATAPPVTTTTTVAPTTTTSSSSTTSTTDNLTGVFDGSSTTSSSSSSTSTTDPSDAPEDGRNLLVSFVLIVLIGGVIAGVVYAVRKMQQDGSAP